MSSIHAEMRTWRQHLALCREEEVKNESGSED